MAEPFLSYRFAKRHQLLATDDGLVQFCQQTPPEALAEAQRLGPLQQQWQQVTAEEIQRQLPLIYQEQSHASGQMMADVNSHVSLQSLKDQLPEPEDLMESSDDAPIIRLINALLTEAIQANASDIHLDSFEQQMLIRFRIDGVLQEMLNPPRHLAAPLVSRIKVMARLDIAEKRLPQDGRISLRIAGHPVDVRVSVLPGGHGERVVMRLLDKSQGQLDLQQLNLTDQANQHLQHILAQPHGIVLVTGPTGSGKTTTLYAALNRLNDRKRNIMTVEDPIEYYLEGISQTPINTRIDMTFARGLRAILRQDPDIVMVGEIRDLETAEIAVQASLTGHLVLSTLHTNSAIGAITRLRDMGVEPYLLSSALIGVIAQRLVRTLCPHCRQARPVTDWERQQYFANITVDTLYDPVGCDHCHQRGYRGRQAVFEVIPMDSTLQEGIHRGISESELQQRARHSVSSIRDDGLRRVVQGKTSLTELNRVIET